MFKAAAAILVIANLNGSPVTSERFRSEGACKHAIEILELELGAVAGSFSMSCKPRTAAE